jgi:hypothetical protein
MSANWWRQNDSIQQKVERAFEAILVTTIRTSRLDLNPFGY